MSARLASPEIAIAASGALWGLYWIPVRYLEAHDIRAAWTTLGIFVAGLIFLAPFLIRRPSVRAAFTPRLAVTGVLTGGAFALYSVSIALTEVAAAILLFYLSPVWATVLGRLMLAERLTRTRLAALGLGLGGLWAVLGGEGSVPLPRNTGDWCALAAGVAWAFGTLRVHQDTATGPAAHVASLFIGGTMMAALLLLLPAVAGGPAPAFTAPAVAIIAAVAVISVASAWGILWGARLVSPGRAGLLLMTEVITGLASAAAFAGEPFGAARIAGSMLIVAAGLTEVLPATLRRHRVPSKRT